MEYSDNDLGRIIKQQRITIQLTLQELAAKAGVSASHLGRIERGERFPSAHILRKIATPLGFEEDELFTLAGYLSLQPHRIAECLPAASAGPLPRNAAARGRRGNLSRHRGWQGCADAASAGATAA